MPRFCIQSPGSAGESLSAAEDRTRPTLTGSDEGSPEVRSLRRALPNTASIETQTRLSGSGCGLAVWRAVLSWQRAWTCDLPVGKAVAWTCPRAGSPESTRIASVVPLLMTGSEVEFQSRGERALKGVPGEWLLFEIRGKRPGVCLRCGGPPEADVDWVGGRQASPD